MPRVHPKQRTTINCFSSGTVRFVDPHLCGHTVDAEKFAGPDGSVSPFAIASFTKQKCIAHSIRDVLWANVTVAREQAAIEKSGWPKSILAI